MKLVRFLKKNSNTAGFGIVRGETIAEIKECSFYTSFTPSGAIYALNEVKLLPPVVPSKVVAVGLNYKDHIEEFGHQMPEYPVLFMKPSTAVIGPEEAIILPSISHHVDYEAELAVVIGKTTRHITTDRVGDHILGYTCFNDVTARDLQRLDGQWTRGKSFDTFAPLGPVIETDIEPGNLTVSLRLNGEIKQSSSTSLLLFPVEELIVFISSVMTLLPGDVIATGTPSGVGPLHAGDNVEVVIEGLGNLVNSVREE